jgi:uncharacterized membrane protein
MRAGTGVAAASVRGVHGVVLAFPVALFTSAVVADIAYLRTAELQWSNFAAWLITGGLLFGAVALICAVLGALLALRTSRLRPWLLHLLLLAAMCVLGLINAFKHSQDGWSSVGAFGLALSILCALLALAASAMAYAGVMDRAGAR